MQQSMSRKGDCWDNACVEPFFKSLKTELIGRQIFATREQARSDTFEHIEVFYNRQRLHSYLDYCTPAGFIEGSGLKCLYMSGYTADVIAHRGVLEEGVSFIAKSFSLATLAEKVREVLDGWRVRR